MIYLDNNATTRPSAGVVTAVHAALTEFWQNPSSVHRPGQAARAQVELARKEAAELIGVKPRELLFTSGGTEAIDLAVRGILGSSALRAERGTPPTSHAAPTESASALRAEPPTIVSSRVEHAAVRDLLEDLDKHGTATIRWAPVDRDGIVDVAALAPLLDGATLAVFQWANNETGGVQPVARIGALCRERRVPFLCDGTQWVGKEPTGGEIPCDLLVCSAHKFHGPKGVGVLWTRRGVGLVPAIHGAQELGRRGGTENVPGIMGAGVACREAREWLRREDERSRLSGLRDRFESLVLAGTPGAVINSHGAARLWNTTNIGFPRLEAEALLLMLSERGVCASAGAACSSGSLDPSPVLLAMGVPPEVAHGSLRFSLSRETTGLEVEEAARVVVECVRRMGA